MIRARTVSAAIALILALVPGASRAGEPPPNSPLIGAVDRPIVVLDHPVQVTAYVDPADSTDSRYSFDFEIEHGAERCSLATSIILGRNATVATALEALRRTIGWRDDYLFVRTECGGGNAWKCVSESVFRLRDDHLVGLGTLLAQYEPEELGSCWHGGRFSDIDADFEGNELTSHAGAPWLSLSLREQEGRLVADVDSTWSLNAHEFAWRDSVAHEHSKPPGEHESWELVLSPRLGNAVLAKYCGRTRQLAAILAEARRVLPGDIMDDFKDLLEEVEPGALPHSSAPPDVERTPR